MIHDQVDGGEDFRRNFVIFVVSTCLHRKKVDKSITWYWTHW